MQNISVSDINDIKNKIQSIDWSLYETAYGNAGEDIPSYTDPTHFIPKMETQLLNLFSDDHETAMEATHNLWCGLCHQYSFVSSAALPACEFLLYGLKILDDELKIELLDILRGFVSVISSDQPRHTWQGKVRKLVEAEKAYFLELAESENEDVAGFSNDILEELWRGGEKDLAAHMEEVLIKRKQERYAEYAEDVEIARGEMKAVKLYPTREVICDLYAIPSDNHQAFYAMVYQEESGYKMVYAKPQIYYPKEHEWTRMYGFRECKEVIREQMQHGSILQGRIVVGIKALSDEFRELLYDLRENVPFKSILEGNEITICDGVFQAIRFLAQGQVVKEVVYEMAERVPVGKKELVKELENMYLTVEEIIA